VDRDEIEHPRFPTARRGLDEAAVHAHLQRVADEFDVLAARTRPASLAEGASSQVREILEAAESSAQALRESALTKASTQAGSSTDGQWGLSRFSSERVAGWVALY